MQQPKYVLVVRMDVAPEMEAEFNDWYEKDHLPALLKVPGALSARRYVSVEGEPKYMALYELANPDVPTTTAWAEARDAGRTAQIRPHMRNRTSNVYRMIYPKE